MGAYYGLGLGLGGAPVPIRGSHIAVGGLLEQYPGAAAAYSLRALRNNIGNVVNVRRSSDSAEQAFTAQDVSDGTLVDFCVPSDVPPLYNQRMYFDGVDDYVRVATTDFRGSDSSGSIKISCVLSSTANEVLFSSSSESVNNVYIYCICISGELFFRIIDSSNFRNDITFDATLEAGVQYDIEIGSTGTAYFANVNGSASAVQSVGFGADDGKWFADISNQRDNFCVGGLIRNSAPQYGKGVFFDARVEDGSGTDILHWQGYGNTNADWEDQIGSDDGTVNGSPALFTGQGFDGFVETWYDQSGNGNDATQTTAGNQPKIVDGGVLVTGGMDFDGVTQFLVVTTPNHFIGDHYFAAVNTPSVTASRDTIFDYRSGQPYVSEYRSSRFEIETTNRGICSVPVVNDTNYLVSCNTDSSASSMAVNGVANGVNRRVSSGTGLFNIGRNGFGAGIYYFEGRQAEIVIWSINQSSNRAAIEANLAAQYGITLA